MWSNHVGIIIGHNGDDYLVAESRVPLSTVTTLSLFIQRSAGQRYAVRRLCGGLTVEQKLQHCEAVDIWPKSAAPIQVKTISPVSYWTE